MRKRDARRYVMARCAEFFAYQNQARVLPVLAIARDMAQRDTLPPEQQAQVRVMIEIIAETARLFSGPINYRCVPQLERARQRFAGALIALSAFDNDEVALKFWGQMILGAEQDWLYLAECSTRPLLEGKNQNWTAADVAKPIPYLAQAARYRQATEEKKYQPRTDEVPIEDYTIATNPAPIGDPPADLIAAVLANADPEVKAYGELALRGHTHDEIRRQLRWYRKHTNSVAARYRRHLKQAARERDLQTLRQVLANWKSNASGTVNRVSFRDNREGRRLGYYEFRPEPDET